MVQVELTCEDKVNAAREQGRAAAAADMKLLQDELQRLQLRRAADADAARKVQSPTPPPLSRNHEQSNLHVLPTLRLSYSLLIYRLLLQRWTLRGSSRAL